MEKFAAGIDLVNMKELLQLSQSALHILLILVLAWMLLRLSGKGIRMLKEYLRSNADNNLE
ncbi:MAG: mechanosensitive ion channel family protein, partial [Sulfurimicrobium sp.]|nr:mechanosensitive ion channel family protein [Sulfurimicrobium sp.]